MKRNVWVLAGGLVLLGLSTMVSSGCNGNIFADAPPRYGWKPIAKETVDLRANEGRYFSLPNEAKMRVIVDADSGVFGGVFRKRDVQNRNLTEAAFMHAPCNFVGEMKAQTTCGFRSPEAAVYEVRDRRSQAGELLGGFLALEHQAKPLANEMAPNHVSIEIDSWACVANCPN